MDAAAPSATTAGNDFKEGYDVGHRRGSDSGKHLDSITGRGLAH
jgi:hypothetical protein